MNDNMGPGFPTPLSTPDTPHGSCLSLLTKDKMKAGTNQILVSVLSPLKSRSLEEGAGAEAGGGGLGEDSCGQDSSGMPTITLEVRTQNLLEISQCLYYDIPSIPLLIAIIKPMGGLVSKDPDSTRRRP